MIVLLDTSTPTCRLALVDGDQRTDKEWEAGRDLAKGLIGYLQDNIGDWQRITGLAAFRGPGSFTGLRIGLTVMNTLADSLHVPIVGTMGEQWQNEALTRLQNGDNDQLVMPEYGSEAHITQPKR
jgi:tRNA threonylcarbamoyladenosine biosynthesis protein TsaB